MRSFAISFALSVLAVRVFAAPPLPRPAPVLDIIDSNGKHVVLSNYRGKVVVLQFLLTNCTHCRAFSGLLDKLQTEYGSKGFQAIGAAVNDPTNEMVRDYQANFGRNFPVAAAPRDKAFGFLGLSVMVRVGFPQIAVIDRKGQIREQSSSDITAVQPLQGESHLRALIERLLAEGALSAFVKP